MKAKNKLKAVRWVVTSLGAMALLAVAVEANASLAIDYTSAVVADGLVENGGPTTFGASSGYTIVGWSFTPTIDLQLNRLGFYDADKDRIHSEQHQVGIWRASSSTLLTSSTIDEATMNVPETSPKGVKFHFQNAAPVILNAGQTYVVAATMYAGAVSGGGTADFDSFAAFDNGESPIFISPYLNYLGNAYTINATNTLVLPTSVFVTDYTIGANLDVSPVPVPAAIWLLGSGIAGVAGLRRKNR